MNLEIIGMHRNVGILEFDDNLDPFGFAPRGKVEQRMFVETELTEHTLQPSIRGVRHEMIVK